MRVAANYATSAILLLVCAASYMTFAASDQKEALSVLRISSDQRALELKRTADAKLQRVDVLGKCGAPAVGKPYLRDPKQTGSVVHVTYGKHCAAEVAIRDLSIKCVGCD